MSFGFGFGFTKITTAIRAAFPPAFSPASLFANNEPGVWFDPSDLSTLYQDAAGTVPVTGVEQPVGLMLDKSKGLALGQEYVKNAADREFTSDTGFWAKEGNSSISGGVVNINNVPGTAAIYKRNFPNAPGGYVEVSFDLAITAGAVHVLYGGAVSQNFTTSGRKTVRLYRPAVNTLGIRSAGSVTALGTIDNISVREIPGNHASQPTATARPIYRASPARIDFDAVDDALITTFPASLGSDCTIARAIPGVGAQILTGQTVGTTFSDTTDHAGLVIVNRPLTPPQTAALTAYLAAKVAP